jgi:hypothetical protein
MHFSVPIFNIRNLGKLKEMLRTNKCLNIEEINSKAWTHILYIIVFELQNKKFREKSKRMIV